MRTRRRSDDEEARAGRIVLLSAAALVAAPGAVKSDSTQTPGPAKVYELRIATATPGRLDDLQALLAF